ncbi:L-fuculose 1-phosphate aldolase (EC 4.1.2.17) [Streptoalloteichus tenebrarius]|uniref:L-fuculose 1-phosphate aldolase n=1 Tax=Streptoalloteichus tenebrarius (strain ATCC 17920 / DSM 40477 / JCM 4838 / CBS 697.72 / NBRC 16177 / NCIMB 11028 / NRRL B-12390 / A12253. 1 / ISP 5477) TaxID=1933 RepID=A0ABT1HR95_STRSD|nr:class II aldolase/adducin family protein [Streptoalloteichus tenebrarius]MCP2258044.1 L-fuculose 1-phosphate aldolase (EC 4.1.2.17) [Streptoalloteichus tenebrarius]BFF01715.1 class II aldolase/adducin family protein [Streptoalloteichus tenebrarius]
MQLFTEREAIVVACRRLVRDRLVVGTAGNLSVRVDDLVAVTPSGVDYDRLTPELVGVHRLDGEAVDAPLAATSELPLHLALYERTDATAVVHTHSPAATALSCLVDEVPPVHYYLALFGGRVRVAEYATYGTPELAESVLAALGGSSACLLANHGALTTGATLTQAYERACYLEWVCDVALRVLSAGGSPRLLTPEQMADAGKITRYGQEPPR